MRQRQRQRDDKQLDGTSQQQRTLGPTRPGRAKERGALSSRRSVIAARGSGR